MNLVSSIAFLNEAVARQRAAVRFHMALASGVVVLGVGAFVVTLFATGSVIPDNLKWLPQLGGAFVATLSGFPVKEIFARKDKIAALMLLRQEFERLQAGPTPTEAQEIERVQQRFWQFVDKSLGG